MYIDVLYILKTVILYIFILAFNPDSAKIAMLII